MPVPDHSAQDHSAQDHNAQDHSAQDHSAQDHSAQDHGAQDHSAAVERAVERCRRLWGEPDLVARAPGRVNLIGDHTDYNDGFTLPLALPFRTALALRSAGDPDRGEVTVHSAGFGTARFTADGWGHAGPVPWAAHLAGTAWLLARAGVPAGGWRAAVDSDIPAGASLSSSAAVEVAVAVALLARAGLAWPAPDIARLGQRVENEIVGLPSGIMDQLISAGAVAGHASLMDCRELTLTPVPVPPEVVVAVLDTGTRRELVDGAYAERRAACRRAADALGVAALRDAQPDQLHRIVDPLDRRRARHVITENARTLAACEALARGDAVTVGRLMTASHHSLRDDFEVSGPALDRMVAAALEAPGCLGARMTGGGFAGCAVALVHRDQAEAFSARVLAAYRSAAATGRVWLCHPGDGAGTVPPDAWG